MEAKYISGIILSGGKSERMGTDKAMVVYKGKKLIELAIDQIMPYCDELIISANNADYQQFQYPVIKDTIKGIGPLGGIVSCISKMKYENALVSACDIPLIQGNILEQMVENLKNADLVYLKTASDPIQPLPILFNKRILPTLEKQLKEKNYKFKSFVNACILDNTLITKAVNSEETLKNINQPEDIE